MLDGGTAVVVFAERGHCDDYQVVLLCVVSSAADAEDACHVGLRTLDASGAGGFGATIRRVAFRAPRRGDAERETLLDRVHRMPAEQMPAGSLVAIPCREGEPPGAADEDCWCVTWMPVEHYVPGPRNTDWL